MVSKTETPYPSSPTIGQMQKLGEMPGVGPGGMPAPGAPLPRLTRSASDEEFQASREGSLWNLAGFFVIALQGSVATLSESSGPGPDTAPSPV